MSTERPGDLQEDRFARMRSRRTTEAARVQRVAAIYGLLVRGYPRTAILQLIAEAAHREKEARMLASLSGEPEPPLVWGDGGPPSERQVGYYVAAAKRQLAKEGRELREFPELADRILAVQSARLNDLYRDALDAGDRVARGRAIELTLRLFGLERAPRR